MSDNTNCPGCGKPLTGVVEVTTAVEGSFVFIVQRETSDCNWTKCMGCRKVTCKQCRRDRPEYCCSEGRIIDRERVRTELAYRDRETITTRQGV